MKVQIHLYGKRKNVGGWMALFEQERVPYLYKGINLHNFSQVNVIVGLKLKKIPSDYKSIFIIEPSVSQVLDSKRYSILDEISDTGDKNIRTYGYAILNELVGEYIGTFKTHKIYNDDLFPMAKINSNYIVLAGNLSGQLSLYGFKDNLIGPDAKGNMVTAHFSPVDKAGILRFLRQITLKAFDMAGIPYAHIWYYPTKKDSIFLFRQDVDYVHELGTKKTQTVTLKYGIKGTYFINIDGGEEFDENGPIDELSIPTTPSRKKVLDRLIKDGNELANHGYLHTVEGSTVECRTNIKRCTDYMKKLFNLREKGYASPGGIYTQALAKAIDKSRMEYACNGSLGSDGFPYYPQIGKQKMKTLEIPFHLVCDGMFEPFTNKSEQSFIQQDLIKYIDQQLNNHEPIAIMGHPHLGGKVADRFYPKIFEKINQKEIPNMTLLEWATWWKKREKFNFGYRLIKGKIQIYGKEGALIEEIWKNKSKLVQIPK